MDKEKIAKIVSQVRSKRESYKQATENTVDPNKEKVLRIANIMLELEKCITELED